MADAFTPDHASADENGQLSLFVILDGFEGPIDLLLSLARDQKVDLSKIAILPLAEQYLAFINSARDLDIDVAADYLVMAAWLAYLKSRLLLPDPEPEEQDEAMGYGRCVEVPVDEAGGDAKCRKTVDDKSKARTRTFCQWPARDI